MPTEPIDPFVRVTGAREHNLRGVDVAAPRDALVVFTGVSGSGKSSLAFGTIYAEAQRRFLESVAPYARRLIEQAGAPQVEQITGLPPAIALQQSRGVPSARSSVGTVSTISNSLRMLFSRAGTYPDGAGRLDSDAFSPNTVIGACPNCHGVGLVHTVTEASLVPDPSLSIREKAVAAWPGAWQGKNYRDILAELGYDVDVPWRDLPQEQRDWILFTDDEPQVTVHPVREAGRIQRDYQGIFVSARRYVLHTYASTQSAPLRRKAAQHIIFGPCPVCGGRRLQPAALAVTVAGRDITALAALPLTELARVLHAWADDPDPAREAAVAEAAVALVGNLAARIATLAELGLGYLSIDRSTPTLSAGELQRLRLGTQLRSGLFGVLYVLDEPSAGLHPADVRSLLTSLDLLRTGGNSLFVVEHDLDVVRHADWIVDVGPGAGQFGGEIVYSGPVAGLADVPASVTGAYLFGRPAARSGQAAVLSRPVRVPAHWLHLRAVTRHNLDRLDVRIPLGVFTAVTGVSGSGKSTLITTVLAELVADRLGGDSSAPDDTDEARVDDDSVDEVLLGPSVAAADGLELIDRLVRVDQKPIGRTPRSNLATYTGLFDAVRKVFAGTEEAQRRGYTASRFSFNVTGGRCPTCLGEGFVSIELLFLPGTYAPCPTCHGARYNPETLQITYRDRTIADVLAMSVRDAREFLADVPAAARSLKTLTDIGLGYLHLGQPATGLSGGEAQRIKLSTELQRGVPEPRARRARARRHTLYLLDEPTTGLHPDDVRRLMRQLHELVDNGSTVVVVEHELDVVAGADWLIDMGPGGGADGGRIVASGPPADVARAGVGVTAAYLARSLVRVRA